MNGVIGTISITSGRVCPKDAGVFMTQIHLAGYNRLTVASEAYKNEIKIRWNAV